MAAKVNKKMVVILIAGVLGMVGLAMVAMNVVLKSGAELAAQGDQFMAKNDYEAAAMAYSKAVNKDQNNVEYYRKWADALSHQNPTSIQAYTDRYRNWLGTQRQIATILRTDPAAHRAVMDLVLREARLSPRPGPAWQSLESDASDIIARMKNEPQEKIDQIRRYRGIATAGKMAQALDVSPEDRARAKEDLLAAMKVNPDDALAAIYYSDLMKFTAQKLRTASNPEEAAVTQAEATAVLTDFCAKHPSSSAGALALYSLEVEDLVVQARSNNTPIAVEAQVKPKVEKLLATLEAEDPKLTDEFIMIQILDYGAMFRLENAVARGVAVYNKFTAAHEGEPFPLLMRARFRANYGSPREAADEFKAIMELPNLPVSPRGINLFGVRDSAALQRVNALIALAEAAQGADERGKVLAETKKARDELFARATVDNAPKALIDAKIAILNGEMSDARRLLDQYHKATAVPDVDAMMLSAQVLLRQNLDGEARFMLNKIVEQGKGTAQVYMQLAVLDIKMQNLPSARGWIESGLQIAPGDPRLLELKKTLEGMENPTASSSPLMEKLNIVQKAMLKTPPDLETVRVKANEALGLCATAKEFYNVATILRGVGRLEGLSAVNRGLDKFPDDAALLQMKKSLEVEDPMKAILASIDDNANLKPIDKAIQRYMVYVQFGKTEEANKALDAAAAIDPEHQVVVAGQFERAVSDRTPDGKIKPEALARARALTQLTKDKNLDKVEGRIYAARMAEVEGNTKEAITLLERASELDAVNPLTWRYLSNLYMTANDPSRALTAIRRSLQIKPDDIASINAHVRLLASMDRTAEALGVARDAARLGIADPAFVHMWLLLEFRAGDKDVAMERRAWILNAQPENVENALEYAKCLLQLKRLDEARKALDGVSAMVAKNGGSKEVERLVTMLRAAIRGVDGDAAGAVADLDKLTTGFTNEQREAAYIDFAALADNLGGTDLAIQVLEKAREFQDPKEARVDRALGDKFFARAMWEKARAAYERARELSPDTEKRLLKRCIECAMKEGKFDQARKLIDADKSDNTKDVQMLMLSAQLELASGNRAKGMNLLDKAVEAAPNDPLPFRQRGIERMADPRTIDDAIIDLEQAQGFDIRNAELTSLLARAYLRKGDPTRALTTIEKALANQPDNAGLRYEYVQFLVNSGRMQDAIDSCNAAIKLDPAGSRWILLKGTLLQRSGDQVGAARCYEEAWKARKGYDIAKAFADALMAAYDASNPRNPALLDSARSVLEDPEAKAESEPVVRLSRVTLALRQNRLPDATTDLKAVLTHPKVNLNDPSSGSGIIDELRRVYAGDMKKVKQLLDAVQPAAGWPDMFQVMVARAQLFTPDLKAAAMDQLDKLMVSSDKAAAAIAAGILGSTAHQTGDISRAIAALQKGLAIDPDNVEMNNNLAYMLSVNQQKHTEAQPFAAKAAEKNPNNPNILDTLGVISLNLNQLEKAEDALNRARSVAPDGATRTMPTVHLIQVKLKKNQRQEADALFRELKDLEASDPAVKKNYAKDIEAIEKEMQATP